MVVRAKIDTDDSSYPCFIQGSDAPLFCGNLENEHSFCCSVCKHILIKNYVETNFLSVKIKCFRCGNFSVTPSIEVGEVVSPRILNIGPNGTFLISTTVNVHDGIILTNDHELHACLENTAPRTTSSGSSLSLSDETLSHYINLYNKLTGNKFEVQNNKLARQNDLGALDFPFVWAVRYLQKLLKTSPFPISNKYFPIGLRWMTLFGEVYDSWSHHPRFLPVAKDLGKKNSFLHTAAQFMFAKYLYEQGNMVGISLENIHGEANPDLYMRGIAGFDRIYIEVKAPRALHDVWQPPLTSELIKSTINSCIQQSVKQINKRRPGALAVFSGIPALGNPTIAERHAEEWLRRHGNNRKSLSMIAILSPENNRLYFRNRKFVQDPYFRIAVKLNPYFEGQQIFNIMEDQQHAP